VWEGHPEKSIIPPEDRCRKSGWWEVAFQVAGPANSEQPIGHKEERASLEKLQKRGGCRKNRFNTKNLHPSKS